MKKISAFFLALLPIFVVVLMFISGMIVKNYTHVYVSAVELTESSVEQQKPDEKNPTHQLTVNVLPLNATNPEVNYVSSNENILKVDAYGKVTCIGFGEAYVYAISKENKTLNASCKFHVWDNKIHNIIINNAGSANYIGINQKFSLDIKTIPSEGIEQDPIKFESSNPAALEVLPNGELIPKQKTESDVKITLTSKIAKQELNVRIGDGVSAIGFKEPNDAVIHEGNTNLFNQLSVFPEKIDNLKPEYFIYTSKNPDVAIVDNKGNVTFSQTGTATFEVTFAPTGATITKKITSTCNHFVDVSFNRFQSTIDIAKMGEDKHADLKDICFNVYPYSTDTSTIKVVSSDEKVVSYDSKYDGAKSKFLINGVGKATLTVIITLSDGSTKQDTCDILVKDTSTIPSYVINESITIRNGTTYYYLRDNVNTDKFDDKYHKIKWSIPDGSGEKIAFVDEDSQEDIEFIHFIKSGTVTVHGEVEGVTSFEFKVSCQSINPSPISLNWDDKEKKPAPALEAGKPYYLKYTVSGTEHDVRLKSDETTPHYKNLIIEQDSKGKTYVIPKHGYRNAEFSLYNDDTKGEYLTNATFSISEKPVSLKFNSNQSTNYITSKKQISLQSDPIIGVIPSTSRPVNEDHYKINFSYEYDKSQIEVDSNDVITFKQESSISVKATVESCTTNFSIKSTFGNLGKFALTDGEKIIQSGDTISLPVNGTKELFLASSLSDAQTVSLASNIKVEHVTSPSVVNCNISFPTGSDRLMFTLNTKEKQFGSDILKISSGKYFFYLTVNAPTIIQGFDLYFNNARLDRASDEKIFVSHTQNLKFSVTANPFQANENLKFKASLNKPDGSTEDISITQPGNIVDISGKLSQSDAIYSLVLSTEDGSIKSTYKFKYNSTISDFNIAEAETDNSIYIECGSVNKVLTIIADGLVDDEFFNQFTFNLNDKTEREKVQRIGNKIIIEGFVSPTISPSYTKKCSLQFGEKTKQYTLNREIVSRIVLPNHDNEDVNDLKGLQRVHVYGNKSMYNAQEGMLPYYKLPINIYDFQGKLIEDTVDKPLKEEAFNTLVCNTDIHATFAYHKMDKNNPKGFVEVHFSDDPNGVYTSDEIYNNAFEQRTKNAIFSICNHTYKAHAKYEFVPVNGVNAYCEEALDCKKTNNYNVVLQTNFGLLDKSLDNMPFTNPEVGEFHDIYGNGYTINFNERTKKYEKHGPADFDIKIAKMFNTSFQASTKEELPKSQSRIKSTPYSSDGCFFEYNTITNTFHGLANWGLGKISNKVHIKNNMFYDNKLVSIHIDGHDDPEAEAPNVYVENCVFFNCSAAAISFLGYGSLNFKGDISVYNFQNQQMLDLRGYPGWGGDYRVLWDKVIDLIADKNVIQINAAGEKNINSNLITVGGATDNVAFWNGKEYVKAKKGSKETCCPYLTNFYNLVIELLSISLGLWATTIEKGAPSYYDEFDKDGKVRLDFMSMQVQKIVRQIPSMYLR